MRKQIILENVLQLYITGTSSSYFCACRKQPRTWSSWSFRVQWFEERGSCSFFLYCL